MKKILVKLVAIIISVAMILSFAACGNNQTNENNSSSNDNNIEQEEGSNGNNIEQDDGNNDNHVSNDSDDLDKEIPEGASAEVQNYVQKLSTDMSSKFVNNLNSSPTKTLSDEEVEAAKESGLLDNCEINPDSLGANKKVIYKKRSANYGMEDLSYMGANNNITYPGALLNINSDGVALTSVIGLKRKPITMSLGVEGATGVDILPQTVENVSLSNVRQGINKMVDGITQSGAELPYMIAMQLTEVKAKEELNAALGLSFNVGSFFDLAAKFDFKNKNERTYAVLTLKQVYFTVDVDYNNEYGVFSLIDDGVTLQKMQSACPIGYAPVYVSSVSYGRIAAITINTSESFSDLSAKLNIGGGFASIGGDFEANFDGSSEISDLQYNWFVYGGSISGNQNVLNGSNIHDMINSLNQPFNPAQTVGVPITYQLSNISDNSSAKIGYVGDYYYAEVVNENGAVQNNKTDRIEKSFNGELRVNDNEDEYDAYGSGYIYLNKCISVDISDLDLDYIKSSGKNIKVVIDLWVREENDGYQEIYLYNAGVSKDDAQKNRAPILASACITHSPGRADKTYKKYTLNAVISADNITRQLLWIAFDAYGNSEDTWYVKNVKITMEATDLATYQMYIENENEAT